MEKEEKKLLDELEKVLLKCEIFIRDNRSPVLQSCVFGLRGTTIGRNVMREMMNRTREEREKLLEAISKGESNEPVNVDSPAGEQTAYTREALKSNSLNQLKDIATNEFGLDKKQVRRTPKAEIIDMIMNVQAERAAMKDMTE